MFSQDTGAGHKVVLIVTAVLAVVFSFYIAGYWGIIIALFTAAGFAGAMAYAYADLKGVSGDLMGFSMTISELCGLVVFALHR